VPNDGASLSWREEARLRRLDALTHRQRARTTRASLSNDTAAQRRR
jgi:hypothetical protein